MSSTPTVGSHSGPRKSLHISHSRVHRNSDAGGRAKKETNFSWGSSSSPHPSPSSCVGVLTHIRHDEPLSPAGSISTPGRETPGNSPLKTSSHLQPSKLGQLSPGPGKNPRLWDSHQGSRSEAGVPQHPHGSWDALPQSTAPSTREDLGPKERGRGVLSLPGISPPAPPAGPGRIRSKAALVTWFSGRRCSLRCKFGDSFKDSLL